MVVVSTVKLQQPWYTISYLRKLWKNINSMLRMRGHVSVGLFRCDVLFLQGKHILIIQVKASKLATYSINSLYALTTI